MCIILEIKDKLNLEVLFLFIVLWLVLFWIFSIIQTNNKKKIENETILNELSNSKINEKVDIFINNEDEAVVKINQAIKNMKNYHKSSEIYLDSFNFIKNNIDKFPNIITIDVLKPLFTKDGITQDYDNDIWDFLEEKYITSHNYEKLIELQNLTSSSIKIESEGLSKFFQYLLKNKKYDIALQWIDKGIYRLSKFYIVEIFNKIINLSDDEQIDKILEILIKNLHSSHHNSIEILLLLDKDKIINVVTQRQYKHNEYSLFYLIIKSYEIISNYNLEIIEDNNFFYRMENINKFYNYVDKLGKDGKNVNALYFLIKYGACRNDTYLNNWIINISKHLLKLGYFDFIKDFYLNFIFVQNNFNFLIQLLPYCIENEDILTAKNIIEIIEKVEPYHTVILKSKKQLEKLEFKIENTKNGNKDLDLLTGIEFEELLCNKFNNMGFFAEITTKTGDFGADIIIHTKNQSKIIVQCKRFKNKVNLKAVQEVLGAVGHYNADAGIVITNNTFLNSAKKLAESNDIELWDETKLKLFLNDDISFSELQHL